MTGGWKVEENQKQVPQPPSHRPLEIAFAISTFPLPRTRFTIHRKENPETNAPTNFPPGSFFDEKMLSLSPK